MAWCNKSNETKVLLQMVMSKFKISAYEMLGFNLFTSNNDKLGLLEVFITTAGNRNIYILMIYRYKNCCLPFWRTCVPLGLVNADFSVLMPWNLEDKSTVRIPLWAILWMSDAGPLSRDVVALLNSQERVYNSCNKATLLCC